MLVYYTRKDLMNLTKEMKIVIPLVVVLGVLFPILLIKYIKYEFAPVKSVSQTAQTTQYHVEPAHHPERTH